MKNRIISTALLWATIILLTGLLGARGANLLLIVACAATQFELYTLFQRMGLKPMSGLGVAAGVAVTAGTFYLDVSIGLMCALAVVAVTLIAMFRCGVGRLTALILPTLGGLALIVFPLAFLNAILLEHGLMFAIWVIAVAKFSDVGGLLVGMWIGKTPLAPAISPKKTWEGVAGGILFAVMAGLLVLLAGQSVLGAVLSPLQSIMIAIPVAIVAVCSDLFESAIKREAGVKDSGAAIPGIGGAYDLTDSVVFAVPVAWLMFRLL